MNNFMSNEKGLSGCAVIVIIVLVGLAAGIGFLYYQFSGLFQHGREAVEEVMVIVEEIEDVEELENIEEIEDLEDLEGIDDIEDMEALQELDTEDIEQIREIAPAVRNIYESIPAGIIDMFQDEEIEEDPEEPVDLAEEEDDEPEKAAEEVLPDSISIHPDLIPVAYREFEDVPDMVWEEFEEEYISEDTIVITYEADFPEREISELRELEQVPEDITDEMIEEERDNLTEIYNIYELAGWYEGELTPAGWEMRGDEGLEDRLFFQHEEKGSFIIAPPENLIYTPLN